MLPSSGDKNEESKEEPNLNSAAEDEVSSRIASMTMTTSIPTSPSSSTTAASISSPNNTGSSHHRQQQQQQQQHSPPHHRAYRPDIGGVGSGHRAPGSPTSKFNKMATAAGQTRLRSQSLGNCSPRGFRPQSHLNHIKIRGDGSPSRSIRNTGLRYSVNTSARSVPVSPVAGIRRYIGLEGHPLPSLPLLQQLRPPPEPTEARQVMESAVAAERARARKMEATEADCNADELRTILKRERHRMGKLAADLAAVRHAAVQSQATAEVEEERHVNSLMRRLDCLQHEKERIIVELEREEEMLTNTLQKKLNQVRNEKLLLEKQIEKEHATNIELQTQLERKKRQSQSHYSVAEALEEEDEMEEED